MTPEIKLEALLFFRGEPMSLRELAKLLQCSEQEVRQALDALSQALQTRGLCLVEANGEVELRTAPAAADFLDAVRKEELNRNLGKAALETLAIILYKGSVPRSDIDYIRGVNSTFILRALLIRGFIERVQNPNDQRSFLYRPTIELLSHLGVRSVNELPEYATVVDDLAAFMAGGEQRQETEHERTTDTRDLE